MPYVEYDEVEAICPDCGRTFRSDEALEAHRREAHAEAKPDAGGAAARSPIPCSICGRRFRTIAALTAHNRRAHQA